MTHQDVAENGIPPFSMTGEIALQQYVRALFSFHRASDVTKKSLTLAFIVRFSTKLPVIAILSTCIIGGAIVRGNYLLGIAAAILFGILASGTLFLVYRGFTTIGEFRVVRRVATLLFASGVFMVLMNPAWFNSDLGMLIEDHQIERVTRSQLQHVLSGDPRFANLDFECNFRKCIIVRVHGRIETESDLLDLRTRILAACPHVSSRWLRWDVAVQESGSTCKGFD